MWEKSAKRQKLPEVIVCEKHAKGCARRLKRRKLPQAIVCEKHLKGCTRRLQRRRTLPEAAVHGKTVKSESYQKQPMQGACEGVCEKAEKGESRHKQLGTRGLRRGT